MRPAHLDLAVALGQQPVADPVSGLEVVSAAPRRVLLAQHALQRAAARIPACQALHSEDRDHSAGGIALEATTV